MAENIDSAGRVERLLKRFQYSEALVILEELQSSEEDEDLKLMALVNLAVCQIMTDQPHEETIERILCVPGSRSLSDKAEKLKKNTEYVAAFVLYECEAVNYVRNGTLPDKIMNNVSSQMGQLFDTMRKRGRLRKVANQTIEKSIERILDLTKNIRHDDKRVLARASCLRAIGYLNIELRQDRKVEAVNKEGIELMTRHFGENAKRYSVYASMLNNLGVAKEDLGNLQEALKLYKESSQVVETAEDYISEETKEKGKSGTLENIDRMTKALSSNKSQQDQSYPNSSGLEEAANASDTTTHQTLLEMKEQAEQLITERKYPDARDALQKLMQRETDDWSKFETALALVECEVMDDKDFGVHFNEFYMLCRQLQNDGEDLEALSDDSLEKTDWVKAFILRHCAIKLHVLFPDKLSRVDGIMKCVESLNGIVENMANIAYLRDAAAEQVIRSMFDALKYFKQITEVDEKIISERVGAILWRIGRSYMALEKYEQQYTAARDGVDYMEEHLGDKAAKSKFHALLLFDQGYSLHQREKYDEAIPVLRRAWNSLHESEDRVFTDRNRKTFQENLEWCEKKSKEKSTAKKTGAIAKTPRDRATTVTYNVFQPGSAYVEKSTEYKTIVNSESIGTVELSSHTDSLGTGDANTKDKQTEQSGQLAVASRMESPMKKSFPQLGLGEVTLADGDVYFDEKHRLRSKYRVFHGVLDGIKPERVAVKIIECDHTDKSSQREPANLCDVSSHPNVLLYRKSGRFQYLGVSSIYLATEICDTETLYEKVIERKLVPPQKMRILKQCTEGLKHIHDNDIAHRDLKPQNVMIALKTGDAKIGDFGFSKEVLKGRSVISQSSTRRGTEGWSAPETYEDDRINPKLADVFSLGLIFYFVLSDGKHPHGEKFRDWAYKIRHNVKMDLSQLNCPNPGPAKELIRRMLKSKPSKRPSVDEILKHPFLKSI